MRAFRKRERRIVPAAVRTAKPSKLIMRNEQHPVKVVDVLAVQDGTARIVFRGDMRPFRIVGGIAIIAVADIAIVKRQSAGRLVTEDDRT